MARSSIEEIMESLGKFKHTIDGTVKFSEVDSFGVVHITDESPQGPWQQLN